MAGINFVKFKADSDVYDIFSPDSRYSKSNEELEKERLEAEKKRLEEKAEGQDEKIHQPESAVKPLEGEDQEESVREEEVQESDAAPEEPKRKVKRDPELGTAGVSSEEYEDYGVGEPAKPSRGARRPSRAVGSVPVGGLGGGGGVSLGGGGIAGVPAIESGEEGPVSGPPPQSQDRGVGDVRKPTTRSNKTTGRGTAPSPPSAPTSKPKATTRSKQVLPSSSSSPSFDVSQAVSQEQSTGEEKKVRSKGKAAKTKQEKKLQELRTLSSSVAMKGDETFPSYIDLSSDIVVNYSVPDVVLACLSKGLSEQKDIDTITEENKNIIRFPKVNSENLRDNSLSVAYIKGLGYFPGIVSTVNIDGGEKKVLKVLTQPDEQGVISSGSKGPRNAVVEFLAAAKEKNIPVNIPSILPLTEESLKDESNKVSGKHRILLDVGGSYEYGFIHPVGSKNVVVVPYRVQGSSPFKNMSVALFLKYRMGWMPDKNSIGFLAEEQLNELINNGKVLLITPDVYMSAKQVLNAVYPSFGIDVVSVYKNMQSTLPEDKKAEFRERFEKIFGDGTFDSYLEGRIPTSSKSQKDQKGDKEEEQIKKEDGGQTIPTGTVEAKEIDSEPKSQAGGETETVGQKPVVPEKQDSPTEEPKTIGTPTPQPSVKSPRVPVKTETSGGKKEPRAKTTDGEDQLMTWVTVKHKPEGGGKTVLQRVRRPEYVPPGRGVVPSQQAESQSPDAPTEQAGTKSPQSKEKKKTASIKFNKTLRKSINVFKRLNLVR